MKFSSIRLQSFYYKYFYLDYKHISSSIFEHEIYYNTITGFGLNIFIDLLLLSFIINIATL